MALTKVRPPVTDISLLSSGTTAVTITSVAGPIDIDIAGIDIMDLTSTTVTVDPAITLDSSLFTGEQILLATGSGAEVTFETQALLARLLTTNAFPLELGANAITGLTIATDGKVELDVEGTAVNHLVTKAYVDTAAGDAVQASDQVGTLASTGSLVFPNSTGTDIIFNWGVNGSIASGATVAVTFDTAYPNAYFVGFANTTTPANHDGCLTTSNGTLTTMDVGSSTGKNTTFDWFSIGY